MYICKNYKNMSDETRHLVQIRPKLYADIKEYCQLNNFKIGWFINDLLQKSFMTEKYGDSPFSNFAKKIVENTEEIPEQIQEVINDHFDEMLSDTTVVDKPDYDITVKKEEVPETNLDKPESKVYYEPIHPTNDWPVEIKLSDNVKEEPKKEIKPKKRKLK